MPDRLSPDPDTAPEPLALAGIGCRFPGGVRDVESFWELLTKGKSAITEVPDDRWDADRYFHTDPEISGRMITKWGGFVDQLKAFDATFWGISPREASRMDPQQRWLLETAWEALEDAGIPPSKLRGSNTGVFVGISSNDYGSLQLSDYSQIDVHTNSGGTMSIAANRISYQFDFKGPSIAVDTACSSALVAVSQACKAIWSGECDSALAGGVNALITPHSSIGFSKANMLSPSGKCFAFDARADGYVRGEGAGLVFLKPLSEALKDRDRVYAVIRVVAVNQDGHTSTMTVPAADSQAEMLGQAYAEAGIPPRRVVYVEAHGTGTPVGDPIEASALGQVLGAGRADGDNCLIGSVKTNLGHLESASGIAGLIKTALILQRETIPPSLNFETPNPRIPFGELNLQVSHKTRPIPHQNGGPPVAAVNSFGFGGTNAHVVLEGGLRTEPEEQIPPRSADRPFVLPISARDEFSLRESAITHRDQLPDCSSELADFCYSAGDRKEHHNERLVILGNNSGQLGDRLDAWIRNGEAAPGIINASRINCPGRVVFVYTGQGPQWWAMGRQLLEREPVFRQTIGRIDDLLSPLTGWSLVEEISRPKDDCRFDQTAIAQPALFALQVALTELWKTWGIAPASVVGHSVGEVAAAYCAGIFSLGDAVRIIFERSRLQEKTAGRGRMLAAGISAAEARRVIGGRAGRVELAAINSPDLVTLAGDAEEIEAIAIALESENRFVRRLPVDYAFHTSQMDPIREDLLDALAGIRPRPGDIPFVSTVTGDVVRGEKLDAPYWWRNVRHPVLFAPAISRLSDRGERLFLEIGPHPSLQSSLRQCLPDSGESNGVFHSLRRDVDESEEILSQLANLHIANQPIDWAAVNRSPGNLVRLPHYRWHYQNHWLDDGEMASRLRAESHAFLGNRISAANPTWRCDLDTKRFRYLRDHRVWNSMVFPASGYAEIGLALAKELFPGDPYVVEAIENCKALFIPENGLRSLQISFEPADQTFSIHSETRGDNRWELNARGRLVLLSKNPPKPEPANLEELRRQMPGRIGHEQHYAEFHAIGYQFGPDFCLIENLYRNEGESLAEIPISDGFRKADESYRFHPALLDACFQSTRGLRGLPPDAIPEDYFFLPESIRRIQIHNDHPPSRIWAHAIQTSGDDATIAADIIVYDDRGDRIAEILGFRAKRMERKQSGSGIDSCLYQFTWKLTAREPEALPAIRGNTLILADEGGVGEALLERIEAAGGTATVVRAGIRYEKSSSTGYTVACDSASDLQRVLADLTAEDTAPDSMVHCWSLDVPDADNLDAATLWGSQTAGVRSALRLSHALGASELTTPPRIYFVTRGAQSVSAIDSVPGIASTPLSGFARVANNEQAENAWTTVDLDTATPDPGAGNLFDELTSGAGDFEVAFRSGSRFVRVLNQAPLESLPKRNHPAGENVPFRLETDNPGVLESLALNETQRRDPEPDEIEVQLKAGGVNFRDVMKALGIYPGNPIDLRWFGDDFAGTILRVGANVVNLEPGDRVAGIAPYCFRSHVTADHRMVFKLPPDMSFDEAATLPTVFLTAHYSLNQLAGLQPGEKVLIHAGSGGVGQAAIQVAQHLGLEVFATAGSAKKRRALSEMGVPHVLNSRTLEFADEIIKITRGGGVDAVLNSLAGPFIPKSLSVLAPFGRFLEIGKVDVYGNSRIGMGSLKNNISYSVIDLAQQLERRPGPVAAMFAELSERFAAGDYRPLPRTIFPVSECAEAFRYMARGKHLGKVVLSFENDRAIEIGLSTGDGRLFRPDATYLIAGGSGGFGWAVAKWMAEQGARTVALLSRSGPGPEVSKEIECLRSRGITVVDRRCDVTESESLAQVIDQIQRDHPPLKGVVHAAMSLDDDFIAALDEARFDRAMKPKILGAWNLHQSTRDLPLDHFICFSSISAIVGGPKQANYNAGNAFLDSLAGYRKSLGLPALSINWGALLGTGFVERNRKTANYLKETGINTFGVHEALRILNDLIHRDPGSIISARVDWRKLGRFNPLVAGSPAFAPVARAQPGDPGGLSISSRILAMPEGERNGIVEDFLAEKVAHVLGIEAGQVDRSTPLTNLGLDSLMAVELINRLESDLGMNVPMGNLMSGPNVAELSESILASLENGSVSDEPDLTRVGIPDNLKTADSRQRALDFWIKELEGAPAKIRWPRPRRSPETGRRTAVLQIDDDLAHRVLLLSAEQGVPPESTLLAAFETFLHGVSGEPDLLVGFSRAEASSIPVPLRSRAGGDPVFTDFLAQTHRGRTSADRVPLPSPAALTGQLATPADLTTWPPHQVEFEFGTRPAGEAVPHPSSELKLSVWLADGTITGNWEGDAGVFEKGSLDRFHEQFLGTLERIVRNPEQPISKLVPRTDEESAKAEAAKRDQPRQIIRFRNGGKIPRADFLTDSKLDPSIIPGEPGAGTHRDPGCLLLTGATGFVGAFLLDELLKRTDARIFCLIRDESEAAGLARIRENLGDYDLEATGFDRRVNPVTGDLSRPLLGLSEARFDELSREIDAIYHNGAEVNLVLPYESLRPVNVNGTREILRLACHRDHAIPVHVVSTFTVHTTADNRGDIVTEADPLPSCDSLLYGYSQSKWVSEKLIEEARRRGLPVSIYRPGHVTGDSGTGASNTGDLLHTMLLACWRLSAAPLRDSEFDVTPVDFVARAVVELSLNQETLGQTFHLTNPHPLQTREFADWINHQGLGVETVPYQEWRRRLLDVARQSRSKELVPLVEILAPRALADDGATAVHPRFNCDRTTAILEEAGIVCPPADTRLFSTYLRYLQAGRSGLTPTLAEAEAIP